MVQIAERNLGGRGQDLQFNAQYGGVANRFSLKFTEPWLLEIPLSASVELYNWFRDYDEFDKKSTGGKLALGYPIWDYTRLYLSYAYDNAKVSNVDNNASVMIKDQEGRIISSTVSTTVKRDTRDHTFLTTRGSDNSLSVDFTGGVLGGDAEFIKYIFNSSWYHPLFWKFVGFLHGKVGYIQEIGDGLIPIYDRFFLGGINSLRAFNAGDVSPRDPDSGDRIGGNKMVLFNAEVLFPLAEDKGVRGVLFFDVGNAYDDGEDINLDNIKSNVGAGIRWHSPMGPLRLEWGYNLDPAPDDDTSNWQFSMGMYF
jgi:outer membrane protein insertion porin family